MKSRLVLRLSILSILLFCSAFSYQSMISAKPAALTSEEAGNFESLYLPNGRILKILSLGFNNTLADFFWLRTINYFGKHYSSDKSYKWLAHRCELIQDLDPKAEHVAEFCAMILAFEAQDAHGARKILLHAINARPEYWRYYYLVGMNYLMFDKNNRKARDYFMLSARKPGALPFVARLAARQSADLNQPDLALDFLKETIDTAKDTSQRKVLIEHYLKTANEIQIRKLEDLIKDYESKTGFKPEKLESLLEFGLENSSLFDPYGNKYSYDKSTGKIISRRHKRIDLFSDQKTVENK